MRHRTIILILIAAAVIISVSVFNFYKKPTIPANRNSPPPVAQYALPFQEGLLPAVEAKRQAIYGAAMARDYEKLNQETSTDFHYSFGGEYKDGFVGYLKLAEKDEGESAFDIIPTLLRLPYANKDGLYTWPSVFTVEPSKWSAEDIATMKKFLTDKQIEDFRQFGGYIYYRLGITSQGDWVFYLAGD